MIYKFKPIHVGRGITIVKIFEYKIINTYLHLIYLYVLPSFLMHNNNMPCIQFQI